MTYLSDVRLKDFLTGREIKTAFAICTHVDAHERNKVLVDKIITPNQIRINRALEAEHDPKFLAYAIEHAFILKHRPGRATPRGFGRGDSKL
jgi:hypothetical protein